MRPNAARFPIFILTLALAAAGAGFALFAAPDATRASPEKKEELIPAGKLKLAGRWMKCRRTPTILSYTFWNYGGADKNGRIILNPTKLEGLPAAVRLYVYAHECGHRIYGQHETGADCYAVRRGVSEGWLDREGINAICEFIIPHPSDDVHPPGRVRCREMRACFDEAKPQSARR